MRPRTRKTLAPSATEVLSHMKRGVGITDNQLAQRCYVTPAVLEGVVWQLLATAQLVRFKAGRTSHLYIAGTEPGANTAPRRASPLDEKRDITESTYCVEFRNHRALAEATRGK